MRDYNLRDRNYRGKLLYTQFSSFSIGDASTNYRLSVSGFDENSTADEKSFVNNHNGKAFSTFDRDHDTSAAVNCAAKYHGAWWYEACLGVHLTATWGDRSVSGMRWYYPYKGTSYRTMYPTYSEMKIRQY